MGDDYLKKKKKKAKLTGKFLWNASNGEWAKYQDPDSVPSNYELKPL